MPYQSWRERQKCNGLDPKTADSLFFPGSGGKPNKARTYCSTCPVEGECLTDAITNKLEGFWSGTTDDERAQMADFQRLAVKPLEMPPEPEKKKKVYRKIIHTEDTHNWLDTDLVSPLDL